MNDNIAISVKSVTKTYRLYDNHADRVKETFHPFRKKYHRTFCALNDVSFDVKKGETFGIIGHNGSGKSTLLQIICKVLKPTSGTVNVKGRIGAILELGTGFNPEFTGRQNVHVSGAILGLKQNEIKTRIKNIESFADIGEFIDQPVKVYSSGMFLRLAFALATSVDADVLVIDEALAVGDVFFRQKCYQRLEALRDIGTTIIIVSHSMVEVEELCDRSLLLHRGQVIFQGIATEAVKRYYLMDQEELLGHQFNQCYEDTQRDELRCTAKYFWPPTEAFLDISRVTQVSNGWIKCTAAALCDDQGNPCYMFQQGQTASFFFEIELLKDMEVLIGGLEILNDRGTIVHGKTTLEYGVSAPSRVLKGSRVRFRQDIDLEIAIGEYTFNFGLSTTSFDNYKNRSAISYRELDEKIVRLCILPNVGQFTVGFRKQGKPVQLLHHGIANLPGSCQIYLL
jgi:ABC-type polysaccharide/polyol phosphate transport system ATPase subunit